MKLDIRIKTLLVLAVISMTMWVAILVADILISKVYSFEMKIAILPPISWVIGKISASIIRAILKDDKEKKHGKKKKKKKL